MTLDEAIKRYTDNAEYERTHGNLQGCLDFKQLAEWFKELKKLREQTRWIPVCERLPEYKYGEDVIITHKDFKGQPTTDVAYFNEFSEFKLFWDEDDPIDVIAWMPLPEPYKSESEYQRQVEQYQYDTLYEPTFDSETGSM